MASMMDSMMPSMPGSYLFQHDHNNYTRDTNRSNNLFQPPNYSPSPSQQRYSQIPRPASRSSNSYSSRKRPRLDTASNPSYFSRPTRPSVYNRSTTASSASLNLDGSYDHVQYDNLDASTYSVDDHGIASPSPLANSEYRLAGGLDTPCASLEQGLDAWAQDEAEKDYRFNRYTKPNASRTTLSEYSSEMMNSEPRTPIPARSDVSGKKRTRSTLSPTRHSGSLTGWGIRRTAWALTGGLAGRVFNFCINTAFGGFQAGGGDTYQISGDPYQPNGTAAEHVNMRSSVFSPDYTQTPSSSKGYMHDFGGFVEDYMNSPEARRRPSEPVPSTSQFDWDCDGLDRSAIKNDWQIIDQVNYADHGEERSPARKRSRASVAGGYQRPASRNSTSGRTASSTGASYASPRPRSSMGANQPERTLSGGPFQPLRRSRPSLAPPRRSQSYLSTTSHTFSGQVSPERPSSSASMRRHQNNANDQGSGLSPEVVNYKRKMKQREKEQDENLRRLNSQLRDMIREGREALGSRVEILDEHVRRSTDSNDVDEGYYEDGWK